MSSKILLVFSLLVNLGLGYFIWNGDKASYFKSVDEYQHLQYVVEKAMESACGFGGVCAVKAFVKNGDTLLEAFADDKQNHINFKSSEINSAVNRVVGSCLQEGKFLFCVQSDVVAIFYSQNCSSCSKEFASEMEELKNSRYHNVLTKFFYQKYNALKEWESEKGQTFFKDAQERIKNLF